jgi:hypothetical protein
MSSELGKGVKDGTGPEGEADEGDRTDAGVPLEDDIRQDESGCFGSVKGVTPWVIYEIAELGEDCASAKMQTY